MGEKWAGLINVYRLHKWPIYRQSWSHLKLCLFAEIEPGCQQRLPFVCERHNVTSVEINPQEAQPGGLPCGNSSLSFRNKVCLRVYSTRCTTAKRIRVLPTHDVHTPVSKCNQSWRHSLYVYLPPTHSTTHPLTHTPTSVPFYSTRQSVCSVYKRTQEAEYRLLYTMMGLMFCCCFFQCYTLLRSVRPLSFKYANEKCQSVRGSLVTISDQVEQGEACMDSLCRVETVNPKFTFIFETF